MKKRIHMTTCLATAGLLALAVCGCFAIEEHPTEWDSSLDMLRSDNSHTAVEDTDTAANDDSDDSDPPILLPCKCDTNESCCQDGCYYDTERSSCDDGDLQTVGDSCGGGLPCVGENYCDVQFCFGVAPTRVHNNYGIDSPLIGLPEAGTPECETTVFCGQDYQYFDINSVGRTFTEVTNDPILVDALTGLYWDQNYYNSSSLGNATAHCNLLNEGDGYGGFKNWRVPTVYELTTLVDYGRYGLPAVDTMDFPEMEIDTDGFPSELARPFYATTPFTLVDYEHWIVNFAFGETTWGSYSGLVRCVRHSDLLSTDSGLLPVANTHRFTPLANDSETTYFDHATGLEWEEFGDTDLTWAEAVAACQALDHGEQGDWRLPNVNELASLVAYDLTTAPFSGLPAMESSVYWTSTTVRSTVSLDQQTSYAWVVDFATGETKKADEGKTLSSGTYDLCPNFGDDDSFVLDTGGGGSGTDTCTFYYPPGLYRTRCVRRLGHRTVP